MNWKAKMQIPRIRWLALIAVLLCAGCRMASGPRPEILKPVIHQAEALQTPGSTIRICTYNVENFSDGVDDDDEDKGIQRNPAIAAQHAADIAANVAEINPDVLILQEVEGLAALELLNTRLPQPYPLAFVTRFKNSGGRVDKLNMAVLSRLPLENVRGIGFDRVAGIVRPPRGLLSLELVMAPDRRLLVYGVHLKSNYGDMERNRARRAKALELLREDAELRMQMLAHVAWEVLLLGDMNVDPANAEFNGDPSLVPLADWVDLWAGRPIEERMTLPTRHGDPTKLFPAACFDRAYVSPALAAPPWVAQPPQSLKRGVDTNNALSQPGVNGHVSDHYPVYLDLVM